MLLRLVILTVLEVLALAGVLGYYLSRIVNGLDRIGGRPDSYLARLTMGLRAIEQESGHLAPQVTQLNQGLAALQQKLGRVDEDLQLVTRIMGGKEGAS